MRRTVDGGPPISIAYQLAPDGLALMPALRERSNWAAENLPT